MEIAVHRSFGHFDDLGMPFGLSNTTASVPNIMHDIFQHLIDDGIVIDIDVIHIYSSMPK